MTHRAMLRFVVVHGHFKHIVAADAYPVNLRLGLPVRADRIRGMLVVAFLALRLTHTPILTRPSLKSARVNDSAKAGTPNPSTRPKNSLPRPRRQHRFASVTIR